MWQMVDMALAFDGCEHIDTHRHQLFKRGNKKEKKRKKKSNTSTCAPSASRVFRGCVAPEHAINARVEQKIPSDTHLGLPRAVNLFGTRGTCRVLQ